MTASEVIGFMRERAHEFSNGFGYGDGRGAVRNFTEGVYDYFGEGDYGFAKDFLGGLVGGLDPPRRRLGRPCHRRLRRIRRHQGLGHLRGIGAAAKNQSG